MENNTEDKILSMNNTNEVVNNLQNSISGLELQISELQNENKTLTRTVKILTSEARRDEEIHRKERRDEFIKMSSIVFIFLTAFMMIFYVSQTNPKIYSIDEETIFFISEAVNAVFLLIIPMSLGAIGAVARIMISGLPIFKNSTVILSSAIMAMFSWVGIKSKILITLLAPHMQKQGVDIQSISGNSQSEFYTMAFVAIIVGMFSSNLYIFMHQKVEFITKTKPPVSNT